MTGRFKGWSADPFALHEFRFFSDDGKPTLLVRDGNVKSYDPPPATTDSAVIAAQDRTRVQEVESEGPEGPELGRELESTAPSHDSHPPTAPTVNGWARPAAESAEFGLSPDQVPPSMPLLSRSARVAYAVVIVAMVVSALALLISHAGGNKDAPPSAKSTATTIAKGAAVTTTTPPTTTLPLPGALQPSAAKAAASLISSWAAGNRSEALSVATAPAVAALFATHYSSGLAIDRGCSVAFSPIVCTYGPPGGAAPTDPIYEVYVTQTPAGWYVSSARVEN